MDLYDIFSDTDPRIFKNAIALRKNLTEPEKILWKILRNRKFYGIKFRRQFPFGKYVADFCCLNKRLIIEIDGDIHNLPIQMEYDKERNSFMMESGYKIIRFTNNEVTNNLDFVLRTIKVALLG